MKSRCFVVIILLLILAACKKNEQPAISEDKDTTDKVLTVVNTHSEAVLKYKEAFSASRDSLDALIGMANWLLKQPSVEKVSLTDHNVVKVYFKNGLITPISVIQVAPNGIHKFRGGGDNASLQGFDLMPPPDEKHVIENDKVMVFVPYLNEFYGSSYPFSSRFTAGKQKLQSTILLRGQADLKAINSFADYGFIIIDSHGMPEGFDILANIPKFDQPNEPGKLELIKTELTSLIAQTNNLPLDKIESGELQLHCIISQMDNTISFTEGVLVTDQYIRKIPRLSNAIVFGNHCYSGFTYLGPGSKNLPEAWKAAGAVTYYGYAYADGKSRKAENDFCIAMEDSLIRNLLFNLDSTGMAHLKNNTVNQFAPARGATRITGGVEVPPPPTAPGEVAVYEKTKYNADYPAIMMDFYFEQFHDKRYRYEPCGDTIVDSRDGQRYPTVCIGDQKWMAKNLNWAGAGVCFENNSGNCDTLGRLYSISELTGGVTSSANPSGVKGICPEGWHVPSKSEWEELFQFVGGVNGATARKLSTASRWPQPNTNTNEYGFNLLPAGQQWKVPNSTADEFRWKNSTSYVWTSSIEDGKYQSFNFALNGVYPGGYNLPAYTIRFTCRCVAD